MTKAGGLAIYIVPLCSRRTEMKYESSYYTVVAVKVARLTVQTKIRSENAFVIFLSIRYLSSVEKKVNRVFDNRDRSTVKIKIKLLRGVLTVVMR